MAALEVELAETRSEQARELARAVDLHTALFSRVDSIVEELEEECLRYEPHGNMLAGTRGPWWSDYRMQVTDW